MNRLIYMTKTSQNNMEFTVRKQSGRSGDKYIVVRHGRRVSTHPHVTPDGAQAEADRLNVYGLVKDFDQDPRPYDVRYAEARDAYYAGDPCKGRGPVLARIVAACERALAA